MKKLFGFLFIGLLSFSCVKDEHNIRFTNNYNMLIRNVTIGSAELLDVYPGASSGYKFIPAGDFQISGQSTQGYLQGSGSVSGKGKHKWSVVLNNDKTITLVHDKN